MNSKRKSEDSVPDKGRRTAGAKAKTGDGNVGGALRTVYDQTVQEDVPQDLLELLKKLS